MTRLLTISVLCLLVQLPLLAPGNELELILYRAPKPLDWSTPGRLVRGAYHNTFHTIGQWQNDQYRYDFYPHSISHVNVRLQCGKGASVYRGMTSDRSTMSYAWDLMVRGRSLETFLIDVKGRFYRNQEVLKWLPVLESQGYVRRFKVLVNDDQCKRAQNYLQQYEQLGLDKIYGGLRTDPLWGQGAGCAAFAVSFLKILNLMSPEFEEKWARTLFVPMKLLSSQERKADIGFWGYVRGGHEGRWARPGESQIMMRFYDPELMYQWIGARGRQAWDVSDHPVPTTEFFHMPLPLIRRNIAHRKAVLNALLSDKAIKDPFYYECSTLGFCP